MSTFECKHRPSPQNWWSELAWNLFWSSLLKAEIYLFPYCRTELYKMPLLLIFWQFSEFKNTHFSDRKFDLDPRGRRDMSHISIEPTLSLICVFDCRKKYIYRTSAANRSCQDTPSKLTNERGCYNCRPITAALTNVDTNVDGIWVSVTKSVQSKINVNIFDFYKL